MRYKIIGVSMFVVITLSTVYLIHWHMRKTQSMADYSARGNSSFKIIVLANEPYYKPEAEELKMDDIGHREKRSFKNKHSTSSEESYYESYEDDDEQMPQSTDGNHVSFIPQNFYDSNGKHGGEESMNLNSKTQHGDKIGMVESTKRTYKYLPEEQILRKKMTLTKSMKPEIMNVPKTQFPGYETEATEFTKPKIVYSPDEQFFRNKIGVTEFVKPKIVLIPEENYSKSDIKMTELERPETIFVPKQQEYEIGVTETIKPKILYTPKEHFSEYDDMRVTKSVLPKPVNLRKQQFPEHDLEVKESLKPKTVYVPEEQEDEMRLIEYNEPKLKYAPKKHFPTDEIKIKKPPMSKVRYDYEDKIKLIDPTTPKIIYSSTEHFHGYEVDAEESVKSKIVPEGKMKITENSSNNADDSEPFSRTKMKKKKSSISKKKKEHFPKYEMKPTEFSNSQLIKGPNDPFPKFGIEVPESGKLKNEYGLKEHFLEYIMNPTKSINSKLIHDSNEGSSKYNIEVTEPEIVNVPEKHLLKYEMQATESANSKLMHNPDVQFPKYDLGEAEPLETTIVSKEQEFPLHGMEMNHSVKTNTAYISEKKNSENETKMKESFTPQTKYMIEASTPKIEYNPTKLFSEYEMKATEFIQPKVIRISEENFSREKKVNAESIKPKIDYTPEEHFFKNNMIMRKSNKSKFSNVLEDEMEVLEYTKPKIIYSPEEMVFRNNMKMKKTNKSVSNNIPKHTMKMTEPMKHKIVHTPKKPFWDIQPFSKYQSVMTESNKFDIAYAPETQFLGDAMKATKYTENNVLNVPENSSHLSRKYQEYKNEIFIPQPEDNMKMAGSSQRRFTYLPKEDSDVKEIYRDLQYKKPIDSKIVSVPHIDLEENNSSPENENFQIKSQIKDKKDVKEFTNHKITRLPDKLFPTDDSYYDSEEFTELEHTQENTESTLHKPTYYHSTEEYFPIDYSYLDNREFHDSLDTTTFDIQGRPKEAMGETESSSSTFTSVPEKYFFTDDSNFGSLESREGLDRTKPSHEIRTTESVKPIVTYATKKQIPTENSHLDIEKTNEDFKNIKFDINSQPQHVIEATEYTTQFDENKTSIEVITRKNTQNPQDQLEMKENQLAQPKTNFDIIYPTENFSDEDSSKGSSENLDYKHFESQFDNNNQATEVTTRKIMHLPLRQFQESKNKTGQQNTDSKDKSAENYNDEDSSEESFEDLDDINFKPQFEDNQKAIESTILHLPHFSDNQFEFARKRPDYQNTNFGIASLKDNFSDENSSEESPEHLEDINTEPQFYEKKKTIEATTRNLSDLPKNRFQLTKNQSSQQNIKVQIKSSGRPFVFEDRNEESSEDLDNTQSRPQFDLKMKDIDVGTRKLHLSEGEFGLDKKLSDKNTNFKIESPEKVFSDDYSSEESPEDLENIELAPQYHYNQEEVKSISRKLPYLLEDQFKLTENESGQIKNPVVLFGFQGASEESFEDEDNTDFEPQFHKKQKAIELTTQNVPHLSEDQFLLAEKQSDQQNIDFKIKSSEDSFSDKDSSQESFEDLEEMIFFPKFDIKNQQIEGTTRNRPHFLENEFEFLGNQSGQQNISAQTEFPAIPPSFEYSSEESFEYLDDINFQPPLDNQKPIESTIRELPHFTENHFGLAKKQPDQKNTDFEIKSGEYSSSFEDSNEESFESTDDIMFEPFFDDKMKTIGAATPKFTYLPEDPFELNKNRTSQRDVNFKIKTKSEEDYEQTTKFNRDKFIIHVPDEDYSDEYSYFENAKLHEGLKKIVFAPKTEEKKKSIGNITHKFMHESDEQWSLNKNHQALDNVHFKSPSENQDIDNIDIKSQPEMKSIDNIYSKSHPEFSLKTAEPIIRTYKYVPSFQLRNTDRYKEKEIPGILRQPEEKIMKTTDFPEREYTYATENSFKMYGDHSDQENFDINLDYKDKRKTTESTQQEFVNVPVKHYHLTKNNRAQENINFGITSQPEQDTRTYTYVPNNHFDLIENHKSLENVNIKSLPEIKMGATEYTTINKFSNLQGNLKLNGNHKTQDNVNFDIHTQPGYEVNTEFVKNKYTHPQNLHFVPEKKQPGLENIVFELEDNIKTTESSKGKVTYVPEYNSDFNNKNQNLENVNFRAQIDDNIFTSPSTTRKFRYVPSMDRHFSGDVNHEGQESINFYTKVKPGEEIKTVESIVRKIMNFPFQTYETVKTTESNEYNVPNISKEQNDSVSVHDNMMTSEYDPHLINNINNEMNAELVRDINEKNTMLRRKEIKTQNSKQQTVENFEKKESILNSTLPTVDQINKNEIIDNINRFNEDVAKSKGSRKKSEGNIITQIKAEKEDSTQQSKILFQADNQMHGNSYTENTNSKDNQELNTLKIFQEGPNAMNKDLVEIREQNIHGIPHSQNHKKIVKDNVETISKKIHTETTQYPNTLSMLTDTHEAMKFELENRNKILKQDLIIAGNTNEIQSNPKKLITTFNGKNVNENTIPFKKIQHQIQEFLNPETQNERNWGILESTTEPTIIYNKEDVDVKNINDKNQSFITMKKNDQKDGQNEPFVIKTDGKISSSASIQHPVILPTVNSIVVGMKTKSNQKSKDIKSNLKRINFQNKENHDIQKTEPKNEISTSQNPMNRFEQLNTDMEDKNNEEKHVPNNPENQNSLLIGKLNSESLDLITKSVFNFKANTSNTIIDSFKKKDFKNKHEILEPHTQDDSFKTKNEGLAKKLKYNQSENSFYSKEKHEKLNSNNFGNSSAEIKNKIEHFEDKNHLKEDENNVDKKMSNGHNSDCEFSTLPSPDEPIVSNFEPSVSFRDYEKVEATIPEMISLKNKSTKKNYLKERRKEYLTVNHPNAITGKGFSTNFTNNSSKSSPDTTQSLKKKTSKFIEKALKIKNDNQQLEEQSQKMSPNLVTKAKEATMNTHELEAKNSSIKEIYFRPQKENNTSNDSIAIFSSAHSFNTFLARGSSLKHIEKFDEDMKDNDQLEAESSPMLVKYLITVKSDLPNVDSSLLSSFPNGTIPEILNPINESAPHDSQTKVRNKELKYIVTMDNKTSLNDVIDIFSSLYSNNSFSLKPTIPKIVNQNSESIQKNDSLSAKIGRRKYIFQLNTPRNETIKQSPSVSSSIGSTVQDFEKQKIGISQYNVSIEGTYDQVTPTSLVNTNDRGLSINDIKLELPINPAITTPMEKKSLNKIDQKSESPENTKEFETVNDQIREKYLDPIKLNKLANKDTESFSSLSSSIPLNVEDTALETIDQSINRIGVSNQIEDVNMLRSQVPVEDITSPSSVNDPNLISSSFMMQTNARDLSHSNENIKNNIQSQAVNGHKNRVPIEYTNSPNFITKPKSLARPSLEETLREDMDNYTLAKAQNKNNSSQDDIQNLPTNRNKEMINQHRPQESEHMKEQYLNPSKEVNLLNKVKTPLHSLPSEGTIPEDIKQTSANIENDAHPIVEYRGNNSVLTTHEDIQTDVNELTSPLSPPSAFHRKTNISGESGQSSQSQEGNDFGRPVKSESISRIPVLMGSNNSANIETKFNSSSLRESFSQESQQSSSNVENIKKTVIQNDNKPMNRFIESENVVKNNIKEISSSDETFAEEEFQKLSQNLKNSNQEQSRNILRNQVRVGETNFSNDTFISVPPSIFSSSEETAFEEHHKPNAEKNILKENQKPSESLKSKIELEANNMPSHHFPLEVILSGSEVHEPIPFLLSSGNTLPTDIQQSSQSQNKTASIFENSVPINDKTLKHTMQNEFMKPVSSMSPPIMKISPEEKESQLNENIEKSDQNKVANIQGIHGNAAPTKDTNTLKKVSNVFSSVSSSIPSPLPKKIPGGTYHSSDNYENVNTNKAPHAQKNRVSIENINLANDLGKQNASSKINPEKMEPSSERVENKSQIEAVNLKKMMPVEETNMLTQVVESNNSLSSYTIQTIPGDIFQPIQSKGSNNQDKAENLRLQVTVEDTTVPSEVTESSFTLPLTIIQTEKTEFSQSKENQNEAENLSSYVTEPYSELLLSTTIQPILEDTIQLSESKQNQTENLQKKVSTMETSLSPDKIEQNWFTPELITETTLSKFVQIGKNSSQNEAEILQINHAREEHATLPAQVTESSFSALSTKQPISGEIGQSKEGKENITQTEDELWHRTMPIKASTMASEVSELNSSLPPSLIQIPIGEVVESTKIIESNEQNKVENVQRNVMHLEHTTLPNEEPFSTLSPLNSLQAFENSQKIKENTNKEDSTDIENYTVMNESQLQEIESYLELFENVQKKLNILSTDTNFININETRAKFKKMSYHTFLLQEQELLDSLERKLQALLENNTLNEENSLHGEYYPEPEIPVIKSPETGNLSNTYFVEQSLESKAKESAKPYQKSKEINSKKGEGYLEDDENAHTTENYMTSPNFSLPSLGEILLEEVHHSRETLKNSNQNENENMNKDSLYQEYTTLPNFNAEPKFPLSSSQIQTNTGELSQSSSTLENNSQVEAENVQQIMSLEETTISNLVTKPNTFLFPFTTQAPLEISQFSESLDKNSQIETKNQSVNFDQKHIFSFDKTLETTTTESITTHPTSFEIISKEAVESGKENEITKKVDRLSLGNETIDKININDKFLINVTNETSSNPIGHENGEVPKEIHQHLVQSLELPMNTGINMNGSSTDAKSHKKIANQYFTIEKNTSIESNKQLDPENVERTNIPREDLTVSNNYFEPNFALSPSILKSIPRGINKPNENILNMHNNVMTPSSSVSSIVPQLIDNGKKEVHNSNESIDNREQSEAVNAQKKISMTESTLPSYTTETISLFPPSFTETISGETDQLNEGIEFKNLNNSKSVLETGVLPDYKNLPNHGAETFFSSPFHTTQTITGQIAESISIVKNDTHNDSESLQKNRMAEIEMNFPISSNQTIFSLSSSVSSPIEDTFKRGFNQSNERTDNKQQNGTENWHISVPTEVTNISSAIQTLGREIGQTNATTENKNQNGDEKSQTNYTPTDITILPNHMTEPYLHVSTPVVQTISRGIRQTIENNNQREAKNQPVQQLLENNVPSPTFSANRSLESTTTLSDDNQSTSFATYFTDFMKYFSSKKDIEEKKMDKSHLIDLDTSETNNKPIAKETIKKSNERHQNLLDFSNFLMANNNDSSHVSDVEEKNPTSNQYIKREISPENMSFLNSQLPENTFSKKHINNDPLFQRNYAVNKNPTDSNDFLRNVESSGTSHFEKEKSKQNYEPIKPYKESNKNNLRNTFDTSRKQNEPTRQKENGFFFDTNNIKEQKGKQEQIQSINLVPQSKNEETLNSNYKIHPQFSIQSIEESKPKYLPDEDGKNEFKILSQDQIVTKLKFLLNNTIFKEKKIEKDINEETLDDVLRIIKDDQKKNETTENDDLKNIVSMKKKSNKNGKTEIHTKEHIKPIENIRETNSKEHIHTNERHFNYNARNSTDDFIISVLNNIDLDNHIGTGNGVATNKFKRENNMKDLNNRQKINDKKNESKEKTIKKGMKKYQKEITKPVSKVKRKNYYLENERTPVIGNSVKMSEEYSDRKKNMLLNSLSKTSKNKNRFLDKEQVNSMEDLSEISEEDENEKIITLSKKYKRKLSRLPTKTKPVIDSIEDLSNEDTQEEILPIKNKLKPKIIFPPIKKTNLKTYNEDVKNKLNRKAKSKNVELQSSEDLNENGLPDIIYVPFKNTDGLDVKSLLLLSNAMSKNKKLMKNYENDQELSHGPDNVNVHSYNSVPIVDENNRPVEEYVGNQNTYAKYIAPRSYESNFENIPYERVSHLKDSVDYGRQYYKESYPENHWKSKYQRRALYEEENEGGRKNRNSFFNLEEPTKEIANIVKTFHDLVRQKNK